MKHGFIKVAAAAPKIQVADTRNNAEEIKKIIREAQNAGAQLLVLPELCVTGYTCADLFLQSTLLDGAMAALQKITAATRGNAMLTIVGLPLHHGNKLYNCAAIISDGQVLGFVPKSEIPNYGEFYEARHFSPAPPENGEIVIAEERVPFGTKLLFTCHTLPEYSVAIEICEDLWVPAPSSNAHAIAGATIIANLSASDEVVGKSDYRRRLVREQSARLIAGYVYSDAGEGESTTDMVFSAHALIAENGSVLAEHKPFSDTGSVTFSEIDVLRLASERRRMTTYPTLERNGYNEIFFDMPMIETTLTHQIDAHPFVPADNYKRRERCETILDIQTYGLKKRLYHVGAKCAVVAVSGGLDSTLALLVTARAMKLLGRPASDIIAISMPGLGTTDRTKNNAQTLIKALGANYLEIPISEAVRIHFRDIGHNEAIEDVTYENSQARERTQIAMDIANKYSGILVGTGDLSELALGWATYNADHMSMYGVNAGVPKSLVRHIVSYYAENAEENLSLVLHDILDTPVSPELLPATDGEISQRTEDIVGPYELHDFFLYYMLRFGTAPDKLFRLAKYAFAGEYDAKMILKWQRIFTQRFFAQQFKRSCLPDGPKVGSVALSPRGDLRMPSDASAALWLDAIDRMMSEPDME